MVTERPRADSVLLIESRAPTRIDLAGGTTDLWPLYLFIDQPVTLNLGIDLFAEARLELGAAGSGILLRSEDQGAELRTSWKALAEQSAPPQLELHLKLLRHFAARRVGPRSETRSLTLSTRARSPAGAGLGGSSTLSIAMIGALATWAGDRGEGTAPVDPSRDGERLIEVARDVETTVIQVPAGMQDYYGAMFGGLQALSWRPGSHQRIGMTSEIMDELERRLLLFYSGQSRNSGINNWALFKAFIDKQEGVREKFGRINRAALKLQAALAARDWAGAGEAIAEEWDTRRTLAAGISTPEMVRAFEHARSLGRVSGKVCGAGGGGCFFIYVQEDGEAEREALKTRIQAALEAQGIRRLPFRAAPHGLQIRVTGE